MYYSAGTPAEVERVYSKFLAGSGIDIVAVQDGVGARVWDTKKQIDDNVSKYLNAFGTACSVASATNSANGQNKVVLWANLESFVQVHGGDRNDRQGGDQRPACIQRLKWQIDSANLVPSVEKLITFEFFHYMNTVTKDAGIYQEPMCERERLYGNYMKEFVPENLFYKNFVPKADCASYSERFCNF